MARQEQIDMLRQGVEKWNTWRQKYPHTKVRLSKAIFSAEFGEVGLRGVSLSGANLSKADLSGANLREAILFEANLLTAELREANLNGANLSKADLSGADLSGARLYNTDLSGADLYAANFSGADLRGADLKEAMLYEANLNEAKIGSTTFGNLDLRTVKGLKNIEHFGPSYISTSTLEQSEGNIPDTFLKGAGLSDRLVDYAHSLFSNPIEYYTCFISYSSQDESFARRLHNDLQQEGVRCWFAPEDMDIGDKIKHRIDESIRIYDKLLLILSEYSIASTWVEYEVERALNKEPRGIPNVLYPVRVDHAIMACNKEWAKDIKSTRHIGNFECWTDLQQYEANFKRLLRALNAKKEQQEN